MGAGAGRCYRGGVSAPPPHIRPAPPRLPGSYLVVELTNRCSLRCVHCSVSEAGHAHHAHTGMLDPALFEGLVDDLVRSGGGFDALVLFWLGEPLIHPHFGRVFRAGLRAAARHGTFGKIEVHSNGTHLDAAKAGALLNRADVPQVLHLSLDAATRDTYRVVKGLDRFEAVEANIEAFLRRRAASGARWPRPVLQFIVGSNNVGEAEAFRARWAGLCRSLGLPVRAAAGHVPPGDDAVVFFRQLDCPTPADQERHNALFRDEMARQGLALPPQSARGERVAADNRAACSGFWKSPVVSWDGHLTTCTRDNLLQNAVGNLKEASFSDLWWGRAMAARRARVADGDYDGLDLCQTCFIPRSLNHADLSADDIGRQAAHDAARAASGGG